MRLVAILRASFLLLLSHINTYGLLVGGSQRRFRVSNLRMVISKIRTAMAANNK